MEDGGRIKGDQGAVEVGDLNPGFDLAVVGCTDDLTRAVGGPVLPGAAFGIARFEDEAAARAEGGMGSGKGAQLVLVGEENLGDVGGHERQIDL